MNKRGNKKDDLPALSDVYLLYDNKLDTLDQTYVVETVSQDNMKYA